MQDRQPGAPGRYKAILTPAEFQKMQAGEQFSITMLRDDQPIVEGTPYSKAAVLPDVLASVICPDVQNPTPADALAALMARNGKPPMTGPLNMDNHRIQHVADPAAASDAVNLRYLKDKGSPFNLLGNSNFANPVNQRGGANYNRTGYNVDRWRATNKIDVTIIPEDEVIEFVCTSDATTRNAFSQRLPWDRAPKTGTNITVALMCHDSGIYIFSGIAPEHGARVSMGTDDSVIAGVHTTLNYESDDYALLAVYMEPGKTLRIGWIAFYEGEYSTKTLPAYRPKDYGAELLECQRYLQRFRTASERKTYCDDFRPTMRMTPNGVVSTFEGEIDGVTYYFASAEL